MPTKTVICGRIKSKQQTKKHFESQEQWWGEQSYITPLRSIVVRAFYAILSRSVSTWFAGPETQIVRFCFSSFFEDASWTERTVPSPGPVKGFQLCNVGRSRAPSLPDSRLPRWALLGIKFCKCLPLKRKCTFSAWIKVQIGTLPEYRPAIAQRPNQVICQWKRVRFYNKPKLSFTTFGTGVTDCRIRFENFRKFLHRSRTKIVECLDGRKTSSKTQWLDMERPSITLNNMRFKIRTITKIVRTIPSGSYFKDDADFVLSTKKITLLKAARTWICRALTIRLCIRQGYPQSCTIKFHNTHSMKKTLIIISIHLETFSLK